VQTSSPSLWVGPMTPHAGAQRRSEILEFENPLTTRGALEIRSSDTLSKSCLLTGLPCTRTLVVTQSAIGPHKYGWMPHIAARLRPRPAGPENWGTQCQGPGPPSAALGARNETAAAEIQCDATRRSLQPRLYSSSLRATRCDAPPDAASTRCAACALVCSSRSRCRRATRSRPSGRRGCAARARRRRGAVQRVVGHRPARG
jgi:hypothetical protein